MSVFYLLLWLIFAMQISFAFAAVGILISAGVYLFDLRYLRYDPKTDWRILKILPLIFLYIVILIKETILSTYAVTRIVLNPDIDVKPCIIFFSSGLKTNAARTALANSITLTPGTITVDIYHDIFCVHCLHPDLAIGLDDSVFVKQLKRMEAR